ncbi:restriction endonuclease subunit S [Psychrobacter sp. FBL11]|uniref:Restriction endonuclease subunit S n=1 Tax=Psychrobacter saeujeotis TaxID=3143436 RepID=A0ABU9XAN0_9GAMM
MKKEWREVHLRDICEFKYGKNLPGSKRVPGKYNVYGSSSVTGTHNEFLVKGPGIIVGRKGTVGKVQYSKEDFFPIDTTYFVDIDTEQVNLLFLYYRLPLCGFEGMNSDAAIPGLNRTAAINCKINLPPLPTQQKIASILSAYDDLIENNIKRIELLEEQAQLIYEEWFVRMKFPDHENTLIDEETGLPEGWKVSTIKDLSEVKGGKRLPKGHELTSEKTSYPYIRVRDLTSGRMNIDEIQYIHHDTHIKIKNYIINHTDLYISIAGTVGLVGTVPKILDSANLTENCAKITNLISEDIKEYLHYFLNSENGQHHISSRTGGASQPKLAIERIRSIPITVPNDDILSRFHNSVGVINGFVENLLIQNQKLKEARDILLPRLMMGVIEV